jgi:hypothetical protein
MKKLVVLLFAVSVLGNISVVFADESDPATDVQTAGVDDGSQLPEGTEPMPESTPAE